MKNVAASPDELIPLTPRVFHILLALVDTGLIEETAERPDVDNDDQRRRYYELTDFGQQALEAEADRLADLVGFARSKKLISKERAS